MHCQTLKEFKELKEVGTFTVDILWEPNGSIARSIRILKKWLGSEPIEVYHLYNYIDPSKAHDCDSGCRVNPWEEPFLRLNDAITAGIQMVDEALQSGKWVHEENIVPDKKTQL